MAQSVFEVLFSFGRAGMRFEMKANSREQPLYVTPCAMPYAPCARRLAEHQRIISLISKLHIREVKAPHGNAG